MEAGDIIAIKGNSNSAPLIKIFTFSKWTHVGVAVNSTQILDAIPSKKDEERADVDLVSKADFIKDAEKVIHFKREPPLTAEQKERLAEFAEYAKTKNYTRTHAGFTLYLPVIFILLTIFFSSLIFSLFSSILVSDNMESIGVYSIGIIVIALIWLGVFKLYKWSTRVKWKVKEVEILFQKTKYGSWVVAKKYDMFCSKLVLLAEQAIDGELCAHLPNEDEIHPKHIVNACIKVKWNTYND